MRLVLSVVAVLALAGYRGGCDPAPYDPCAGKACGDGCRLCDPDDAGCVETAVVKACDPAGRCMTAGTFACAEDACVGKSCGDACAYELPCGRANPPCTMPSIPGQCSLYGRCLPYTSTCKPVDDCGGQPCGTPCAQPDPVCYPEWCPVPSACYHGGCASIDLPWACDDPCSGKACGDACNPCAPAECMSPVAFACDIARSCVPQAPWLCHDPCAGKKCGERCHPCPPDVPDCVEPAVMMACDVYGRCAMEPGTAWNAPPVCPP